MTAQLRPGRRVGRTLYVQREEDPGDDDVLVGVVDTPALARLICSIVNSGSQAQLDELDETAP